MLIIVWFYFCVYIYTSFVEAVRERQNNQKLFWIFVFGFFLFQRMEEFQWKERVLIITLSTTAVDSAEKKHRRSWFIVRQHFYQKYDGMVYLSFTRCYANSSVGTVFIKRKTRIFYLIQIPFLHLKTKTTG